MGMGCKIFLKKKQNRGSTELIGNIQKRQPPFFVHTLEQVRKKLSDGKHVKEYI